MQASKSRGFSKILIISSMIYAVYSIVAIKSPFHYYDIFIASALFISALLLSIVLFLINLSYLIIRKEIFPLIIFMICALFSWLLPSISPEDVSFSLHRTNYENVVEMARQHELEQGEYCQQEEYILPDGFEDLSRNTCIIVIYDPEFEVLFNPKVPGRFLIYTDRLSVNTFCNGFGSIDKEINNHWYICQEYWN
jgi:hypothetical protein